MDQLSVTQVNDVFYLDRFDGRAHVRGTLHLTLTHIFFVGTSRKQEIWLHNQLISDVEKLPLTTGGAPLIIYGKNFRIIHLLIPRERDCHEVFTTVKQLKFVESIVELSCFRLVPLSCQWDRLEGWDTFSLKSQFERFGVPNSSWILTDVNKYYKICDTYPTLLCVPATVTQPMLEASSRFRSRGRIPVLTYLHPSGKSSLCRSSQPLAGFASRCVEDQLLLEAIRLASPTPCSVLYVVDTRPALNALTNRAQGKGYEDVTVYRNVVIQFFDIENIHVVRSSLGRLLRVTQDPAISIDSFIAGVEQSGWLRHMQIILEAAFFVSTRLNEGYSVLVHCSDGWDRTTQVCSLAQIILDPYYRTFSGLEALIKKEWLQFGHKFSERCGLTNSSDAREISPIFTQFLDCLRHLCELCPTEFEYNSNLLCLLHDEAHSAEYGTFVGCSEMEREQLNVREATYSVWPLIRRHSERFTNPYYKNANLSCSFCEGKPVPGGSNDTSIPNGVDLTIPCEAADRSAVDPLPSFVLAPQLFRLWRGLFLRWEWRLPKLERRISETISDVACGLQTLTSHGRLLEARISQLCALLKRPLDSVLPSLSATTSRETSSSNKPFEHKSDGSIQCNPPSDSFHPCDKPVSNGPSSCESVTNPQVSLPLLSVDQIMTEVNSVSAEWAHLARQDVPCSNCGALLALTDHSVHCHHCGQNVCSKCLNQKPRTLAGLWYPQFHKVWVCERCAAMLDRKISLSKLNPSSPFSSSIDQQSSQTRCSTD